MVLQQVDSIPES